MSASKRPSTSSLRRFLTSRPYVPVGEIRRRFGLDEFDGMAQIARGGQVCYVGLPEREASKLQDLWSRSEVELELSVEVRAPVVIGVYPMRIARYVIDGNANGYPPAGQAANGHFTTNGHFTNGHLPVQHGQPEELNYSGGHLRAPIPSAPSYVTGTASPPSVAGAEESRPPAPRA
jgi:hypothetical protein